MIISHKYKYIFLKTRKTAGTSIEIALSKFCGDKDIITPISPADEKMRSDFGYRGPQNYHIPYLQYLLGNLKNGVFHGERRHFYNHIPACVVQRYVGAKVWNTYYKFCVERNPWDKSISRYYWDKARGKTTRTYKEYIPTLPKSLISCYEIYSINHNVAVDKVILYENLSEEIDAISQEIEFPEKLVLTRAKGNYRKDKRHYKDLIEYNERKYIADMCKNEIHLFGYEF